MQLVNTQFTKTSRSQATTSAPSPTSAEIRAPQGSLPGVSGFQVSFSSEEIYTPGDAPDVLVAMNPAALKTNIADLPRGGILVVNEDEFSETNLKKAAYATNPLEDGSLQPYRVFRVPISTLKGALRTAGSPGCRSTAARTCSRWA
jgi:2-oxoglutarate ferredoxin oxidoreductase subunit alpha